MSQEHQVGTIENEKQWEDVKKKIISFLEKQIGEQQWDYFEAPENLKELAQQHNCVNGGHFYWLEETFTMYQRIAAHRHLPSAERKKLYYRETAKGNKRLHHIVESQQFEAEEIERYCDLALLLKKYDAFCTEISDRERDEHELPIKVVEAQRDIRSRLGNLLKGRIIINLFIQPSSRTHRSFEAAEKMLGADVINEKDPNMSSMAKGETGPDTVRTFKQYGHAIVQRAPANYAAEESILAQHEEGENIYEQKIPGFRQDIPIINAGSGSRQHPTQALLDIVTIKESLGLKKLEELNGKTVTIIGDLLYGRTVRSLIYTLSRVAPQVKLRLVSPKQLCLPDKFKKHLQEKGVHFEEMEDMNEAIKGVDVVYVTRIQQEWFKANNQMQLYHDIKDDYLMTEEHFQLLGDNTVLIDTLNGEEDDHDGEQQVAVMHPLPRVNELSWKTDKYSQSRIWEQVKNGKYVRAALLLALFGKDKEFQRIVEEHHDIDRLGKAAS